MHSPLPLFLSSLQKFLFIVLVISASSFQQAHASSAELAFSNDTVLVGASLPLTPVLSSSFNLGYQTKHSTHGGAGIFVETKTVGDFLMDVGLGLKAFGVNYKSIDRAGIFAGIGSYVRVPLAIGVPLSVEAQVYYAPEILSFMTKANHLFDWRTSVALNVIPQGDFFLGYGKGFVGFSDRANETFHESFFLGVRLRF